MKALVTSTMRDASSTNRSRVLKVEKITSKYYCLLLIHGCPIILIARTLLTRPDVHAKISGNSENISFVHRSNSLILTPGKNLVTYYSGIIYSKRIGRRKVILPICRLLSYKFFYTFYQIVIFNEKPLRIVAKRIYVYKIFNFLNCIVYIFLHYRNYFSLSLSFSLPRSFDFMKEK